jgi:ketosteroid isomerase-like protein
MTNSERVRTLLEQLFRDRRIDSSLLSDDVEWVNPPEAVEPGTRQGAAAFNRAVESVFATWDDVHFEIEEILENGDHVLALGELHGRLHASGMDVSSPHAQLWTFRDGRAVRMEWSQDRERALEAAGLAE